MVKRLAANKMLIAMAVATLCAVPLGVSAHDHWDHGDQYRHEWHHEDRHGDRDEWHGDRDDWHRDRGDWHRGGDRWRHDDRDGGRWIAGAIVSGAVEGLIDNAAAPTARYYDAPPRVVYRRRVIYREAPVVTRTVVYSAPYGSRDDDDDGD